MFSIDKFSERLQDYLQQTFNIKATCERINQTNEKTKMITNRISIKLLGQTEDLENALQDLDTLFSSLQTKIYNDQTGKEMNKDYNFPKIEANAFRKPMDKN